MDLWREVIFGDLMKERGNELSVEAIKQKSHGCMENGAISTGYLIKY